MRHETLLLTKYDPYWEFEDLMTSKLLSAGDRPTIERHDVSRSVLKSLVSMKLGLGLMLESDAGVRVPSIVFRELRDGAGASTIGFSAFWREANDNPALASFVRLLKDRDQSAADFRNIDATIWIYLIEQLSSTLTFEAQNLREARELCHEPWLKEDLEGSIRWRSVVGWKSQTESAGGATG